MQLQKREKQAKKGIKIQALLADNANNIFERNLNSFLELQKKLGAPCGTPSNDMFLILQLQFVSVLNELAHSPNGAYVQVVVENHNVGILATLQ